MPTVVPRLFLITPPVEDGGVFAPLLEAAMDAADVASVLLRSAVRDEAGTKALIRQLAPVVQARGAALLIEGDPRLVARVGADGVHVDEGIDLLDAIEALHPRNIVGAGRLNSRDAAMRAGEAGADYLMFGGPGTGQTHEAVTERIAWWAEIFNVPCVGYAEQPDQAAAVARAGAEFVALCDGLWTDRASLVTTLASVTRAISAVEVAA